MTDVDNLRRTCLDLVTASGLTVVGESFVAFPEYQGQPGGVTGTVLLAESHLAIHTWPERDFAAIDIFMCGSCDPYEAVKTLKEALKPEYVQLNEARRGLVS